jgi:hypothetical protein
VSKGATDAGYCIHCGTHEGRHTMTCPRALSYGELDKTKDKAPKDAAVYVPTPGGNNDLPPTRVPMTEKQKAMVDHTTVGSVINIKMVCFGKASEHLWTGLTPNDAKPNFDDVVRKANTLYEWVMLNKMPLAEVRDIKGLN